MTTIRVTTAMLVSGDRYGSLLTQKCTGYLAYSCNDIVWWCKWSLQHWWRDGMRWRLCGNERR